MLHDDRDRTVVRNAAVVVTTLAWAGLLWPLRATDAHVHAEGQHHLSAIVDAAATWLLMLAAMMTPVLIQPVQFVRGSGLARRRACRTTMFLLGYGFIWMLAGTVMMLFATAVQVARATPALPATAMVGLAALWQCSPVKQICLNHCHVRPPLPAFGWRADLAVLRFGASHAWWCMGSCWALMLVPAMLPAGHAVAMAAAAALIVCERLERPAVPAWRWRGTGTAWRALTARWQLNPLSSGLRPSSR